MKKANKNKAKNNSYKPIIISAIIIVFVLVLVFGSMMVIPFVVGRTTLNKNIAAFSNISADDVIILYNPMASSGFEKEKASEIFEANKMYDLSESLVKVLRKAEYSESRDLVTGAWDINVSLRSGNEDYKIYFTDDDFYVVKHYTAYIFEPNDSLEDEYEVFYKRLEAVFSKNS